MPYKIEPATSLYDGGVIKLFEESGIPIEPAYWERAYEQDQPGAGPCRPMIIVKDGTDVCGFASLRPRTLHVKGEEISSQILFNFLVSNRVGTEETITEFVKELIKQAEITFALGSGLEATRILDKERFLRGGTFFRFRMMPGQFRPPKDIPLPELQKSDQVPESVEDLLKEMIEDDQYYFNRSAQSIQWMNRGPASLSREILFHEENNKLQYIVISRTVKGTESNEMQVVEALCRRGKVKEMALAIAAKAHSRKMPLYWSFYGGTWAQQFDACGYDRRRPRWPFFWYIRDPKQRSIANMLLRHEHWHLMPVDGEIDHS